MLTPCPGPSASAAQMQPQSLSGTGCTDAGSGHGVILLHLVAYLPGDLIHDPAITWWLATLAIPGQCVWRKDMGCALLLAMGTLLKENKVCIGLLAF